MKLLSLLLTLTLTLTLAHSLTQTNAYDPNCINANEFTHCDISPRSNECRTCMNNVGYDYSWVQQYMAYYISGNCDGLAMKIYGSGFNTVYKYNLYNNETINICSDKANGDFVFDVNTYLDYTTAVDENNPCMIGVNLFIGTPIENICNSN
jgi:hypothetical protein